METETVSAPHSTLARLAYSINESRALSGLSRSSLYRLIERGELRTVKRGQRRLVPSAELERLCGVSDQSASGDIGAVAPAAER
jgi:excisionase family DNA binding protein